MRNARGDAYTRCPGTIGPQQEPAGTRTRNKAMGIGDMRRETESLRQARDDLVAQLKHRTEELERVNEALRAEIAERERAEADREHLLKRQERYANLLRKAGDRLEKRVGRRTAELAAANDALEAEIGERRLAQGRLEAERRRLFSVLNMLPGFVLLRGEDNTIRFANHRFLDTFGDPAGRPCYAVIRGHETPCEVCYAKEVLEAGEPREWIWPDIRGRDYHVWAHPFADSHGGRLVLELGIDITERRELEREILKISGEEQRRIGRDLHDVLGQNLAGVAFLSKVLSQRLQAAGWPEADRAVEIANLVSETVAQARAISRGLCSVELSEGGLRNALEQTAAGVEEVFGIPCTLQYGLEKGVFDRTTAVHLYRITQEAVNNATRHGSPEHVWITLAREDGGVVLTVRDDGAGVPEDAGAKGGMGLRIMKYRADIIGASLDVGRGPEGGTVVACTLLGERADGRERTP